jgi:hypothetical protein
VRAAERADEVRRQDELPELLRHGVEIGEVDRLQRAGVPAFVDQDVELPQRRDRFADHPLGVARRRDVAGGRDDLQPGARQPRDLLRRAVVLRQMVHGDGGAVPRKQLDGREPDARRAAGDEDGLAGKDRR